MANTILLLGATGLFGGHLARRLLADGHDVVLAARDEARLAAFADAHGGRIAAIDRTQGDGVARALAEIRPAIVIDAAGPFQLYGDDPYRFAQEALNAGAHYLDVADASAFVAGIGSLDDLAQARGLVALSGASTTPAISSAALDALTEGMTRVEAVEAAVVPGNRTERGLSVIRAILSQTGQPFQVWWGSRWETVFGWDQTRPVSLAAGGHGFTRPAALNDTPDIPLFPDRYKARTVLFRAGLELRLLHHGLAVARWLVRAGAMRSLAPLSRLSYWFSSRLVRFGSDTGGMKVTALGETGAGWERREWDLVAADGVGPRIPAEPAALLAAKILDGGLRAGARPAIGELDLSEIETALAAFGVVAERRDVQVRPLFAQIPAIDPGRLSPPVRSLHTRLGLWRYRGRARIDGATGWRERIAARIAGFPGTVEDTEVEVTIDADDRQEVWVRRFGTRRFRSVLRRRGDRATERFGLFTFTLGLTEENGDLLYPVLSGSFLGIPLPGFLLPISETRESVDEEGRFTFDVHISLRGGGRVAHYRGWLVPDP